MLRPLWCVQCVVCIQHEHTDHILVSGGYEGTNEGGGEGGGATLVIGKFNCHLTPVITLH